jgi:hypothetical protein
LGLGGLGCMGSLSYWFRPALAGLQHRLRRGKVGCLGGRGGMGSPRADLRY